MVAEKSTIRLGPSNQSKHISLFVSSRAPASMPPHTSNKSARLSPICCPNIRSRNGSRDSRQRNGVLCWWQGANHGERSSSDAKTAQDTSWWAAISLALPSRQTRHKQLSVLPLLYPDEMLDGVLFETYYSEKNNESVPSLGAIRGQAPSQVAFAFASRWVLPCHLTYYISCDITCPRRKPVPFQGRPGGLQHQTRGSWHEARATLRRQRGQQNYVERVPFLRVLQTYESNVSSWQGMSEFHVTTFESERLKLQ